MAALGLVDGGEDTLVDPEGHGGGDEGQTEVGHHRNEGDVLDGQHDHQDGPEHNPGVPGVLPVYQVIPDLRRQPHFDKLVPLLDILLKWSQN